MIRTRRYVRSVEVSIMKKKISIGHAALTSMNGVEKCGGAVEKLLKTCQDASFQNINHRMMRIKTELLFRMRQKCKRL